MSATLRAQLLTRIRDLAHELSAPTIQPPPAAADELEAALTDVTEGRLDAARSRLDAMVAT